jgi:ABC-2 type transport system permease protein
MSKAQSWMRKYWYVFSLYWQEGLAQRSSFLMERFRSLIVLLSFYYLWDALLKNRTAFAGYDRSQIITYVLGMNVLRGLVFATRTDQLPGEINHGRLSAYLLRPVNFFGYTFMRDLSEKTINLVSAVIEVLGLAFLFHMPIRWPHVGATWLAFTAALIGAVGIYFLISFMEGCWGFWTAESWGPRFLIEMILEFTAGAFFPLDVLPKNLQHLFMLFPSPYLVFFPLNIFLEKISPHDMAAGFACQLFWVAFFVGLTRFVWNKGLAAYEAEGS